VRQNAIYFVLTIFLVTRVVFLNSQSSTSSHFAIQKPSQFVKDKDPFGGRVFIENKGQFKPISGNTVNYAIDNGLEKIYFTGKGLVYQLTKVYPITERQMERMEKGDTSAIKPDKYYYVNMNWIGCANNIEIEPSEKQSHYITYGARELNSYTYKKITYKNVYNNIDIEYIIPENKNRGIKYSLIIHPGANPADVKIAYSGDVDKIKLSDNSVIIKTPLDDLIEHAPYSFYNNGSVVSSSFVLKDDLITFDFPDGFNNAETLIVDPWVASTSTLTSNTYAFDVDYDFLGNTFVYGGSSNYKVACYNTSGTLQWVFSGSITTPLTWSSGSSYPSNFGVDRFTSKAYIGQGFNPTGNYIVRLDATGNYDNFVNTVQSTYQEVWDMGFHCTTADVFVLGGGTNSNISAATMNSLTAALTLSTFQPTISSGFQDIASHAIDDAANIFILYASGNTNLNNKIILANSTFNGTTWMQPTGYSTFFELNSKNSYPGVSIVSNGFNALAVNANYLFYYDGYNLAAYNKTTGSVITSTTVSGQTVKQQGGIAVDDCNNIYLGGNGSIVAFNYNGSVFSQLSSISLGLTSTYQNVFDIKLDKQMKILYVSGSGFAGTYSPVHTLSCPTASSACLLAQGGIGISSSSITCASLGTATCTAVGGIGPWTYTWLPSMQQGSVANNLGPGTQAIIVHDIGNNNTYTAATYISPLVPFTGTVPPVALNCYGVNNATAAVLNLSGGSGNQNYMWTNGTSTLTTPVASNLGVGVYTVTVTDALTACQVIQTFTITQPPALTLNIGATTPTACANSSIMLTPLIGGGTSGYTYSWTAGPTTGPWLTTQTVGGTYIYSLTVTDSKSCAITQTISLNFLYTPTLSISNVSICPQQAGTLTVSGANSYVWSNNTTGNTFTASPLSTTMYSVVGSGSLCIASASASIIVKPVPVPLIASNSPVCNGKPLQLLAGGGSVYSWNGPPAFVSAIQNPTINPITLNNNGVYGVTVTAANSCTASASCTVTVNPTPPVSVIGSTACVTQTLNLTGNSTNGVSYQWHGPNNFISSLQNPTVITPAVYMSGNYSLTVTDGNGCTNSAIANVTITALPLPIVSNNSPRCSGLSLNFSGSGGLGYSWAGPNGFNSGLQNPVINNVTLPASGVYTLDVITGPCVSTATTWVTVYPLPVPTITNSGAPCETKSLSLIASESSNDVILSYFWSGPQTFTASTPAITILNSGPQHSGVYTVTLHDGNSCEASATTTVTIMPNPNIAAKGATVCLHQPAILSATGAVTYTWTGPSFYSSLLNHAVISKADGLSVGMYTVVGTGANSCTSSVNVFLDTIPLPIPSIVVNPKNELCVNELINLEGFGGVGYEWHGPANLYATGKVLTFTATSVNYAGDYSVTVADINGCRSGSITTIVVYNLPGGVLGGDKMQACVPFCSDLKLYPTPGISGLFTANWQVNSKLFSGKSFSCCFNEPGDYLITGKLLDTVHYCANTVTFAVNAFPLPVADFSYSPVTPVENTDDVIFTSTSTGDELTKFNWFFVDNDHYTGDHQNASFFFKEAGMYPVALNVKNIWGCEDTIVKIINVNPDFHLFIPNAFTPNSDDNNDLFLPVGRGVKFYTLSVFDRWGEKIFQTGDILQGWDGTYKGAPCQNGVYVWKINATGVNDENKSMKGHVTLYR
jgi:gliding motility-associated-like protein